MENMREFHIWVQDDVNLDLLREEYTDIEYHYKGCNRLKSIFCKYRGVPARVHFYTKYEVNKHLELYLFCGLLLQRIIILEDVKISSAMYLYGRLYKGFIKTLPENQNKIITTNAIQYEFDRNGEPCVVTCQGKLVDISYEFLEEVLHEVL